MQWIRFGSYALVMALGLSGCGSSSGGGGDGGDRGGERRDGRRDSDGRREGGDRNQPRGDRESPESCSLATEEGGRACAEPTYSEDPTDFRDLCVQFGTYLRERCPSSRFAQVCRDDAYEITDSRSDRARILRIDVFYPAGADIQCTGTIERI